MRKLPAVEDARAIMTEGLEWGMWRWLLEKRRVRTIADLATEALDEADAAAKAGWTDELKRAYDHLVIKEGKVTRHKPARHHTAGKVDPQVAAVARRVAEADDEAERTRLLAEDIFAEGERRMSVSLAREGARTALKTYDLRESAIRKSEAAARSEAVAKAR